MDLLEMFGCEIYVEQTFVTMDILTSSALTSHRIVFETNAGLIPGFKKRKIPQTPGSVQQYFHSQRRAM